MSGEGATAASPTANGHSVDSNKKTPGSVQEKISCVFESIVVEEPSSKRNYQPYKVVAVDQVRQSALIADISNARATEKLDGTCVFIHLYQDLPWLWARHDRKPSKPADKKFKKYQGILRAWQAGGEVGPKPMFEWDPEKDFKSVPSDWLAASGVELSEDTKVPLPDEGGHIFGWVPVDPRGRMHLWHASTVDFDAGVAVVLQMCMNHKCDLLPALLEIALVPLKDLMGATLELIGTNVNGNPYRLGSKKHPFHILVQHGSIPLDKLDLTHEALTKWFQAPCGQVEGVVWYCPDGTMYKVHRHHLNQKWPVEGLTSLETMPVVLNTNNATDFSLEADSPLCQFVKLNGRTFPSLKELSEFWGAQIE